ncbi:MAG TPA: hypothetical protein VFP36_03160 [Usitatibacter sp.]|nr:hypothetical protein [Usitatibacter sp.]
MRNARLKSLMEEVLKSLPKPYTEDVIEDVFAAIENDPKWLKEYQDLHYHLGKNMVNPWGGFWIARLTGRTAGEQVSATRTKLIDSYSKLAKGPKVAVTKVKEPEALKSMSEYFFANRETLPASVREQRSLILELIKSGLAAADAFAKVLEKPAIAR